MKDSKTLVVEKDGEAADEEYRRKRFVNNVDYK